MYQISTSNSHLVTTKVPSLFRSAHISSFSVYHFLASSVSDLAEPRPTSPLLSATYYLRFYLKHCTHSAWTLPSVYFLAPFTASSSTPSLSTSKSMTARIHFSTDGEVAHQQLSLFLRKFTPALTAKTTPGIVSLNFIQRELPRSHSFGTSWCSRASLLPLSSKHPSSRYSTLNLAGRRFIFLFSFQSSSGHVLHSVSDNAIYFIPSTVKKTYNITYQCSQYTTSYLTDGFPIIRKFSSLKQNKMS